MRVLLENGKFVFETAYDERFKAKSAGAEWNDSRRQWEVQANLLSAHQLVRAAHPTDDIAVAKTWIAGWEQVSPLVVPETQIPLMPHQVKGASQILAKKRYYITFDMGCGKSATVIGAAQEAFKAKEIDLVLIAVPLSVFGSWDRQVNKFCKVPFKVVHLSGAKAIRIKKMEAIATLREMLPQRRLTFALINYESLRVLEKQIAKMGPGMFVQDESSFLKNRRAKMTKAACAISILAKYSVGLTGTPISNNIADLFGQLAAINPAFVGEGYHGYMNFVGEFAKFGGFKGKEIVGARNLDFLGTLMKMFSYRVRKEEVVQLPERTWETREVTLSGDQKAAYDAAGKEFYFAVDAVKKRLYQYEREEGATGPGTVENVRVLIKNAMVRLVRCQQIAGGHCKEEGGETVIWPDNPKIVELLSVARESGDQKIVVFCRFVEDIEACASALKANGHTVEVYFGRTSQEDRIRIETEFLKPESKIKAVIVQVRTGGFGIDFSTASICVFFNNWFSWSVRDQAESRLHRIGQKRNVLYVDLVAKDTVDTAILETVLEKKSLSETLFGRKFAPIDREAELAISS